MGTAADLGAEALGGAALLIYEVKALVVELVHQGVEVQGCQRPAHRAAISTTCRTASKSNNLARPLSGSSGMNDGHATQLLINRHQFMIRYLAIPKNHSFYYD
jgi:hypothetical protein